MSEKIVQLNEKVIKGQIKELVRGSVARQGYRSGHYNRNLTTTSGDVTLHVPRLKGVSFETAIIERYRRRTRVVGTFPDGNSALMLVCARLRHVAGTQWGCKKYMNMKHLETALDAAFIAG